MNMQFLINSYVHSFYTQYDIIVVVSTLSLNIIKNNFVVIKMYDSMPKVDYRKQLLYSILVDCSLLG